MEYYIFLDHFSVSLLDYINVNVPGVINLVDDIVIYIETSGSMSEYSDANIKFCEDVLGSLPISSTESRAALISFGDEVSTIHWDLNDPRATNYADIIDGVRSISYTGGAWDVWLGFQTAYDILSSQGR